MALTLIGKPTIIELPNIGYHVTGFGAFTTTSLTGELPIIKNCRRLLGPPVVVPLAAPTTAGSTVQDQVGLISASAAFQMRVPVTGTVSAAGFVVDTTVATDAANIWTIGILNHSAADAVVVDIAVAANSNNSTGGAAFTANTLRALTLGAGVAVTAGDLLEWTFTKASSAANLTETLLILTVTPSGGVFSEAIGVDESSLVALSTSSDGLAYLTAAFNSSISPVGYSVTLWRSGQSITSGLKFGYVYDGKP